MSDEMKEFTPLPEIVIPKTKDPIAFARELRMNMISAMVQRGTALSDSKDMGNLIKLVDGVTKQALGEERNRNDKEAVGLNRDIVQAGLEIVRRLGTTNPYEVAPGTTTTTRQAPVIELDKLPDTEVPESMLATAPRSKQEWAEGDEDN